MSVTLLHFCLSARKILSSSIYYLSSFNSISII